MCYTTYRVVTNEVEEETNLRREIDEHVAELREDYEQTNGQKMATYEAELAEWKNYEKARVSPCMYNIYGNTCIVIHVDGVN